MRTRLSFSMLADQRLIILPLLLIIIFFFSAQLDIYSFLKNYLSIPDSYLLDQGLFFFIFLAFLVIFTLAKIKTIFTYKNLLAFVLLTVLLAGYFVFLLNYQSELLNRYFVKDDQFVLLPALLRDEALDYRYVNKLDYYYYHFGASVLLFKFFHLKAYFYNLFNLATLALSGVIFLKLLHRLNTLHKLPRVWGLPLIFAVTLLFLVSPSIMDSFVYLEHSTAIGYIVAGTILSIYLYILFLEKKTKTIYFLLSFLLMLFLLKTAMVRAGFLPVLLIALELVNIKRTKNEVNKFVPGGIKTAIIRIVLIFLPFYIIAKPYLSPLGNSGSRLYGIGIDRFVDFDRIYLFFVNIIPVFLPFQFMSPIFRSIRIIALGEFNSVTTNFALNHMLFTAGLVFFVLTSVLIFILFLKKRDVRYILFFWIATTGSLLFYMLFGNTIEKKLPPAHIMDLSLLSYGTVPGSRYYPLPLVFILTTLYLIFTSLVSSLGKKTRTISFCFISLVMSLVIWSNINFTQAVNHSANEGIVTVKIITEKVLSMVPDNNDNKVIFSTDGRINDIEYIIRGFHGFFKYKAPDYFWEEKELVNFLKENKISKNNFYAFHFDRKTLKVEDRSDVGRKKFNNYFLEATSTP